MFSFSFFSWNWQLPLLVCVQFFFLSLELALPLLVCVQFFFLSLELATSLTCVCSVFLSFLGTGNFPYLCVFSFSFFPWNWQLPLLVFVQFFFLSLELATSLSCHSQIVDAWFGCYQFELLLLYCCFTSTVNI